MSAHILIVPALLGSTAAIPPQPVPTYQTQAVASADALPSAQEQLQVPQTAAVEEKPAEPVMTTGDTASDSEAAPASADGEIAQVQPLDPAQSEDVRAEDEDEYIVVTARASSPADPVAVLNEASYEAVQLVDDLVVGPVTHTYMKLVPEPVQDGVHNVINNLDEPIVALNFLLQLKLGKALETVGRFAINSTLGVGGLFDVAKKKPFNLPRRSNGLADTLGYYGVGPGPYLFLPLIGSTTVRDLVGRPFDLLLLPTAVGKPFSNPVVSGAKGTLSSLDDRRVNDDKFKRIRNETDDPYVAMREEYLQRRQAEIDVLRGLRTSVDDPTPPVKRGKKALESLNTADNTPGPVSAAPAVTTPSTVEDAPIRPEPSLGAETARDMSPPESVAMPAAAEETP